jgi:predicted MFS family arabinose efflux permease
MVAATGGVAASVGVLSPILTYWISTRARAQGWELGRQAAAGSLGIAVGTAAGGLLFDVSRAPGLWFVLTAGLVTVGVFLSLSLPRTLRRAVLGHQGHADGAP